MKNKINKTFGGWVQSIECEDTIGIICAVIIWLLAMGFLSMYE